MPLSDPAATRSLRPLWELPAWWQLASISVASCLLMVPAAVGLQRVAEPLAVVAGFIALGSVLAQGCLLAVWLAWGDAPFGRRLLHHWVAASVLCLLWLAGLFLVLLAGTLLGFRSDGEQPAVAFTVAMTVPLISLATQFPLWAMRQLFGWRLVRAASDFEVEPEQPWSIRDLFVATLIAGVAIGIARLSPAFLYFPGWWILWAMGGTAACVITSITILPAALLLLRNESFGRGVRYSWLYACSYVVLLWLLVAVVRLFGLTGLPPYYAFIGISCLILAFAGTVILAAKVARALGYRLVTRARRTHSAWTLQPAR
jgi:hypothetical protein